MPILSILACEMLEDELVYVLSNDPGIKQLYIVENTNSFRFVKKLKSKELRPLIFPFDRLPSILLENNQNSFIEFLLDLFGHLFIIRKQDAIIKKNNLPVIIVVNLLPKTLHADINLLHSEVCQNAGKMAKFSDGILLFYGKCGYNSQKANDELKQLACPTYFLEDESREIADDCISVALGGNDIYMRTKNIGNGKGSIYATPMWSSSFQEGKNITKYLKSSEYGQIFKINTFNTKDSEYHKRVSDFAKTFDMTVIEINGTMEIALGSYKTAKSGVCKK